MPLTVGTAGHVDHGKTWLVRVLTGKDTDRLPEEQARGISIDLGYAPLELPGGKRISLIDVPGHERFVRTMVAGATGIDLFLLVIDAAEGARAQTHEHLAILRLLGIEHGVVAVTKADAVDAGTLEHALGAARALVPSAVAVAVSAKTGAGIEELRRALGDAAALVDRRPPLGATRLFVDRTFALRGIGTVATGTLWAGTIGAGDVLRVEPSGLAVRIRSVQVHDRDVERAEAGQRVAVSLPGVERTDLRRGDALVEPGAYPVAYRLDVLLDELEPVADGARVHAHHGTAELAARVVRVGEGYAQLRLDTPAVAARGDRIVLRAGTTVAGARVLDPAPPRRPDPHRLALLERGDPSSILAAVVHEPIGREALLARGLLSPAELDAGLESLEHAGAWFFTRPWLDDIRARLRERLHEQAAASPLDPGIPIPQEPWLEDVLPLLAVERRGAKLYLPEAVPTLGDRAAEAERLERRLEESGFDPIRIDDRALAAFLEAEGRLVRVGDGFAVAAAAFETAKRALVTECEQAGGRITLARYRDLLGVSRRAAQLLLDRFDADGLTRRVGDERELRRARLGRR